MMERFIEAVNNFYIEELNLEPEELLAEVPEDGIVSLAYTTYTFGDEEEEREVQVSFDINTLSFINLIDGKVVLVQKARSLEDAADYIDGCPFDEMISDCIHEGYRMSRWS